MCPGQREATPENYRGLALKFFAYHGGVLVLDAVVNGLSQTTIPQSFEDAVRWIEDAQTQIVRSRAATAAYLLEINKDNVIPMMKLAIRCNKPNEKSNIDAQPTAEAWEKQAEQILAAVEQGIFGKWAESVRECTSLLNDGIASDAMSRTADHAARGMTLQEPASNSYVSPELDDGAAAEPMLEPIAI
jgi:hypothetical protein